LQGLFFRIPEDPRESWKKSGLVQWHDKSMFPFPRHEFVLRIHPDFSGAFYRQEAANPGLIVARDIQTNPMVIL
jgi:hypothetical protein